MHYTPCSYSTTNRPKKECAQRSQCKQLRSTKLVRIVSMLCFVVCHLCLGGIFLFCILFLLFHCVAFLQLVIEIVFEFTWVFTLSGDHTSKEALVMTFYFSETPSIILFCSFWWRCDLCVWVPLCVSLYFHDGFIFSIHNNGNVNVAIVSCERYQKIYY